MKIIRFVDIVDTRVNGNGELEETLIQSNFTLPMIIDEGRVDAIYPLFGNNGKLFKNVSIIKYDNEMLKVVGNYKQLHNLKEGRESTSIGFLNGKQTKETIEDRTKVKSKPKRRAKRSNKKVL